MLYIYITYIQSPEFIGTMFHNVPMFHEVPRPYEDSEASKQRGTKRKYDATQPAAMDKICLGFGAAAKSKKNSSVEGPSDAKRVRVNRNAKHLVL